MTLASFRESSELEFGADDAFILTPDANGSTVTLKHLKARHSEPKDLTLTFDRRSAIALASHGSGRKR